MLFPIVLKLAGVTHSNPDGSSRQVLLRRTSVGDPLFLRREQDNPYDTQAIAVEWKESLGSPPLILGYIPGNIAALLSPVIDSNNIDLFCEIAAIIGSSQSTMGLKIRISWGKF
jgi:hypothetical protein